MVKSNTIANNLIIPKSSIVSILVFNILRDLGLIPTLKGSKLLNKAIQIVVNSDSDFIVLEDIYTKIASSYTGFNAVQVKNAIKYAIDTRNSSKAIANFENIFGYPYDKYFFTNKIMIEEIARVVRSKLEL